MKKLLIPILLVVVLGIAAAVVFLVVLPGTEKEEPDWTTYHTPGDFIVTNIKDSARLMKVTVVLAIRDEVDKKNTHEEELTLMQHRIRDEIIFIVRGHTEPELRSDDIRERLTEEIMTALKENLDMHYLVNVYYNDFVLQ